MLSPGSLRLVPPEDQAAEWRRDYHAMRTECSSDLCRASKKFCRLPASSKSVSIGQPDDDDYVNVNRASGRAPNGGLRSLQECDSLKEISRLRITFPGFRPV